MKNDCQSIHTPNYDKSCCLKHLVLMNEQAEINLLINKYGYLLLRTLNHYYKLKQIYYETFSLDNLLTFLEIISKYSAKLYFNKRNDYSKLLVKIALKSCNVTVYKDNPDVVIRKLAIINNIACIYETEKAYDKALIYAKRALDLSNANFERAIVYNNCARIFLKKGNKEMTLMNIKLSYESFKDEIENIRKESRAVKDRISMMKKAQLVSYLLYNYAFTLEKLENGKEMILQIFKRGLEFSVSILGENNFFTLKYRRKMIEVKGLSLQPSNKTYKEERNEEENNSGIFLKNIKEEEKKIKAKPRERKSVSVNVNPPNIEPYLADTDIKESEHLTRHFKQKGEDVNFGSSPVFECKALPAKAGQDPDKAKSALMVDHDLKKEEDNSIKEPQALVTQCNEEISNSCEPEQKEKFEGNTTNTTTAIDPPQCLSAIIKPKRHLKDLFSMVIPAKPKKSVQFGLSSIFKLSKSFDVSTDYKERSKSNLSIKIPNKYDDFMSNFDKKSQLLNIKEIEPYFNIRMINNLPNDQKEEVFRKSSMPTGKVYLEGSQCDKIKVKQRTTDYFKYYLTSKQKLGEDDKKQMEKDMIEKVIDFTFLDNENNYYKKKQFENESLSMFITRIIDNPAETINNSVSIIRALDQELVKINISVHESNDTKGLAVKIIRQGSGDCINSQMVSYERFFECVSQAQILNSLPRHVTVDFIRNLESLLKSAFIYHCVVVQSLDGSKVLGITKNPISVNSPSIEFEFFKRICTIQFCVVDRYITMIIYSQANINLFMQFDIISDISSFNSLFKELPEEKFAISENETLVKSYTILDIHSQKSGFFFQNTLLKLQEIFKLKLNDEQITFEALVKRYNNAVFKLNVEDKLGKVDFWMISYEGGFKWIVDYYSLKKIEISDNSYYINKSLTLDEQDYLNIIGSDPKDTLCLLNSREMEITHTLLLNSVKMCNIMMQILTEKNYNSRIRLLKTTPLCFFKLKFSLMHNRHYFIVAFEFLVYSKESFFLRLLITESLTCRSYSQIFCPFYMISTLNSPEQLRKSLEEKFQLSKKLLENSEVKVKIKEILKDFSLRILNKGVKVNQYENIDVILAKLNSIQALNINQDI